MPRQIRRPALTLHKPTGQARVRIDGQDHYLGAYGSAEAKDAYDEHISEWLSRQDVSRVTLTIDSLALLYLKHAAAYYRHPDGTPTGEAQNIRIALRILTETQGSLRVRNFGPKALKDIRERMIQGGNGRRYINAAVAKVKRMFKWGVAEELVPESVWRSLSAVEGLRAGRSKARETAGVGPVPDATVQATLPFLSPVVADMVQFQLLTGARPGEVCGLRPCDVTRGDGVWTYKPESHKTLYRGKERRIFIGPQAQAILAPYLLRDSEAFCFSPRESEAKRNALRRFKRQTPMTPSQARRKAKGRTVQIRFTKNTYNRSVQRGCEAAFSMPAELRSVGRTVRRMTEITEQEREAIRKQLSREASTWRARFCWSPNQLRHSRATLLRSLYGIEVAQVVLGHSDPRTTLIYAESNFAKAAEVESPHLAARLPVGSPKG